MSLKQEVCKTNQISLEEKGFLESKSVNVFWTTMLLFTTHIVKDRWTAFSQQMWLVEFVNDFTAAGQSAGAVPVAAAPPGGDRRQQSSESWSCFKMLTGLSVDHYWVYL